MNTKAMHIAKWRWPSLKLGLIWLWLCLLSVPGHALTLGDLAVSSSVAPSFSGSFPFSDDRPVRLAEMQARLATRGEYARWGYPTPSVLRELRVRVVPASETVGYIELYSPAPLSQNNFDLLVWSTYAGQTTMTHYRVNLNEVPSLIKGKTLSSAQVLTTTSKVETPAVASTEKSKKNPRTSKAVPTVASASSDTVQAAETESAPVPTSSVQDKPLPIQEPVNPTPIATAVNGSASETRTAQETPSDTPTSLQATDAASPSLALKESGSAFNMASIILVSSLVLFLVGFLVGRLRGNQIKTPTLQAAPARTHTERDDTDSQQTRTRPGDREFFGTVSATAFAQATLPKRTELRADLHEELPQPMVMPAPALHAQATSSVMVRKPASALPTPGLAHASVHSRKTGQTKSAAHANIDLAKIYLSMGDPSTAQMLLQQVIEQGNEAEKTTASQLLKNMA
jgi:FimV-like protein